MRGHIFSTWQSPRKLYFEGFGTKDNSHADSVWNSREEIQIKVTHKKPYSEKRNSQLRSSSLEL
jgi:hypothetical protein